MTPRRYDMSGRARQTADTRRRIIGAATQLHARQGVLATSWEEIAERAEVAPATVYRHFPSLVELIPACARTIFDIIKPPTIDEAATKFAALPTAAARLEILIRDSCACYAKGEGWLHAARRERDLIPAVGDAVALQERTLAVLVRAAVRGTGMSRGDLAVLHTFCDFPFWKSLIDTGVARTRAADVIVDVATSYLKEHSKGVDAEHKRRKK